MALISCPHCGKRISDRTTICPHCQAVLLQKSDASLVSKKGSFSDNKRSALEITFATVEAFVFTALLGAILSIICSGFMGEGARRAFTQGSIAFFPVMLVILVIGLIALCALPMVLKKSSKTKVRSFSIAISAFLALAFGLFSFLHSSAVRFLEAANVDAWIIDYAVPVLFFYAVTLPLYQGTFYLLFQDANRRRKYRAQAVFAGGAFVVTALLAIIAIAVLKMGTQGASFAGALTALITFVLATIRKKQE